MLRLPLKKAFALVRRHAIDREFDAAQSRIALAADDHARQGSPHDDARVRVGSAATALEEHRKSRGFPHPEAIAFEIRLAARGLHRDWTYALASIVMLALALTLKHHCVHSDGCHAFSGFPAGQSQ